jgi:hypothetical protein
LVICAFVAHQDLVALHFLYHQCLVIRIFTDQFEWGEAGKLTLKNQFFNIIFNMFHFKFILLSCGKVVLWLYLNS